MKPIDKSSGALGGGLLCGLGVGLFYLKADIFVFVGCILLGLGLGLLLTLFVRSSCCCCSGYKDDKCQYKNL